MTTIHKVYYAWLNHRAIPFLLAHPRFGFALFWRRLAFMFVHRFLGQSLRSPETGELIFNTQSLINYWAMHVVREMGTKWQRSIRETLEPWVFDVGANMGQFGQWVRSVNPTASIVAIEPQPGLRLFNNYAARCHSVAVGESEGQVELTLGYGWTASTDDGFYHGKKITVPQVTLDHIWHECGRPEVDLLKIDVDGAERGVLAGGREMLDHVKILIVEVNSTSMRKQLPAEFKWKTINHHDWIGFRKTA